MNKVVFFIQAYNAEKTLRRAVESILGQTCGDIVCYLCDDASADGTRDIMREYAEKDSRVRTIFYDINHRAEGGTGIIPVFPFCASTLYEQCSDADYFCLLDADDEYKSDFLERMLPFAIDNNLDIAACGYDSINEQTGKSIGVRKLPENIIVTGNVFGAQFPIYHQYFRSVWAKLYRISVLKQCDFANNAKLKTAHPVGVDAMFNLRAMSFAQRIGVLSENLLNYYVVQGSLTKQFDSKRVVTDRMLFDDTTEFLEKKTGAVSAVNKEFLLGVYLLATMDTLSVLIQSNLTVEDKLGKIDDILKYPLTEEVLSLDFSATTMLSSPAMIDTKNRFINDLTSWVSSNSPA